MKIIPLAGESLGTRSTATLVETAGGAILIDPGVALAPNRFGKPPHPIEIKREGEHWKAIARAAKKVQVMTLSHYHYDHHDPGSPELWKGKVAFVKHPTENINQSQRGRAREFLPRIEKVAEQLNYSENQKFQMGKTKVWFSPAMPHGQDVKLGSVVMTVVEDGKERFLHSGDVEGPPLKEQTDFIVKADPTIALIDGPMCWMAWRYPPSLTKASAKNLVTILQKTSIEKLILEHHFMRELKYRERIPEVYAAAKKLRKEVLTSAEFLGKENDQLEARRAELFKKEPVEISKLGPYVKGME